jgi:hypothetical protein
VFLRLKGTFDSYQGNAPALGALSTQHGASIGDEWSTLMSDLKDMRGKAIGRYRQGGKSRRHTD